MDFNGVPQKSPYLKLYPITHNMDDEYGYYYSLLIITQKFSKNEKFSVRHAGPKSAPDVDGKWDKRAI